jgi:hypothetical protein
MAMFLFASEPNGPVEFSAAELAASRAKSFKDRAKSGQAIDAHVFQHIARCGRSESLDHGVSRPRQNPTERVEAVERWVTGRMARTLYEKDVVRWAQEQARLLREGDFAHLDIEHIADEIEDVGKAEQRELASRTAVLLAHLLKWRFQPQLRTKSWRDTIDIQRKGIALRIEATPSLKATLGDQAWQDDIWLDALKAAIAETGLDPAVFPGACPWPIEQALGPDFWPDQT